MPQHIFLNNDLRKYIVICKSKWGIIKTLSIPHDGHTISYNLESGKCSLTDVNT